MVTGRTPVTSGVAPLQQQKQQDEEVVVWDFEELFAEVRPEVGANRWSFSCLPAY
jgi:hypothetical protein